MRFLRRLFPAASAFSPDALSDVVRPRSKWDPDPPPIPVSCANDVHRRVLDEGGGMMSDALVCVDCGLFKYPEVFGVAKHIRRMVDGGYIGSSYDAPPENANTRANRERAWTLAGKPSEAAS